MKKIYCFTCLIFTCLAVTSCIMVRNIPRNDTVNSYKNPHIQCISCHGTAVPEGDKPAFPAGVDPSEKCLDCHNYFVNHHPVNMIPKLPVKISFPLYKGEVTCLTCHEIHGGPEQNGTSMLLRGGPYRNPRTFCFECHTHEQYENIDPHKMIDASGQRSMINGQRVCLYCHVHEPDPTKDTANQVLFKADVSFLCWRCHQMKHGEFLDRHILAKPSKIMLDFMNRPGAREQFSLPLIPRDRITCSTCHNPHQKGVITYGPAAAGADSPNKLRNGNICKGCHEL